MKRIIQVVLIAVTTFSLNGKMTLTIDKESKLWKKVQTGRKSAAIQCTVGQLDEAFIPELAEKGSATVNSEHPFSCNGDAYVEVDGMVTPDMRFDKNATYELDCSDKRCKKSLKVTKKAKKK